MKKFTYLDYLKYTRETKLNSMFVLREDSAEYKLEKIHQPQVKVYKIDPIVLYTGKKKWNAKKYLEECQEKIKYLGLFFGKMTNIG